MFDRVEHDWPLDLAGTLASTDWRRQLRWPLPHETHRRIAQRPLRAYAGIISRFAGPERDALLLAGPVITALARQLVDAAALQEEVSKAGRRPRTAGTIAKAVAGDGEAAREVTRSALLGMAAPIPSRASLRRLARIASWSGPLGLLGSALRPEAVAISHNSLLVAQATSSGRRVGYEHSARLLASARERSTASGAPGKLARSAGILVATELCAEPALSLSRQTLLADILTPVAISATDMAARDLAALEGSIPGAAEIWSATGGSYPSRAVGLSALAQGRLVRRHDHVGTGCLVADRIGFDFTERVVSSEVVVATDHLARFAVNAATEQLQPMGRIVAGAGDPDFQLSSTPRTRGSQPTVVYATTLLRGERQYNDALLPDPVYLDWQMRVSEALSQLPVGLVVKPHPATRYPDGRDLLAEVAPVSTEPFEALMPRADVYVFDFGQTTTFWKGLASAQPVVYLDLGLSPLQPEVQRALARRAVVVPVAYDGRNLPVLEPERLADAIFAAKPAGEDNPFRVWLGGGSAA